MTTKRAMIFFSCVFPFVGAYFYFLQLQSPAQSQIVYSSSKLLQLLLPFVCWFFFRSWFPKNEATSLKKKWIFEGFASGLLFFTSMLLIYFFIFKDMNVITEAKPMLIEKIKLFHVTTAWQFGLLAVFISFVHSLFEEFYWRGFVHQLCLQEMRPFWARLLSALGFLGHHVIVLYTFLKPSGNLIYVPLFSAFVFFAGWVWAVLYERHQSLMGTWLSHILADLGIMAIGYWIMF